MRSQRVEDSPPIFEFGCELAVKAGLAPTPSKPSYVCRAGRAETLAFVRVKAPGFGVPFFIDRANNIPHDLRRTRHASENRSPWSLLNRHHAGHRLATLRNHHLGMLIMDLVQQRQALGLE